MAIGSDNPIILFDGVCNLCADSVLFVIKRDRQAKFRFAQLQSDVAADMLGPFDYQQDKLSSVLLIVDGVLYRKSKAGLQIARRLDGLWPVFYYLFFWLPAFIGDPMYDFIGNRRYKWFGKKDECWVPNQELKNRFLDSASSEE